MQARSDPRGPLEAAPATAVGSAALESAASILLYEYYCTVMGYGPYGYTKYPH